MADSKLNIIINGVDKASGVFGGIRNALGGIANVAGGILAAGAIQQIGSQFIELGKDAIKGASDLAETANKINVVFGEAAGAINDFAADAATSLGQSRQSALDAAATFGVFGKSAGLTGEGLADFSTELVGLSSDLASFYNTSPEEAIQALGAAMRGEAEPIRRYGVLLDDATMRQKALEMGLISTTKQALTPQQKVLAAYQVILDQTADAQGDFARTSDGLANSQRISAAMTENLKTKFGELLMPLQMLGQKVLLNTVLPAADKFINDFLTPAVPMVQAFADTVQNRGLIDGLEMLGVQLFNVNPEAARVFFGIADALRWITTEATNLYNLLVNGDFTGLFGLMEDSAWVDGLFNARDGFLQLGQAVANSIPMVMAYVGDMRDYLVDTFNEVGPQLLDSLGETLEVLAELWRDHGESIMAVVNFAWRLIIATIGGAAVVIGGLVQGLVTMINGIMDVFSLMFQGKWQEAFTRAQQITAQLTAIVYSTIANFFSRALSVTGSNLARFVGVWQSNFNMAYNIVKTILDRAITYLQGGISRMTYIGAQLIEGLKIGMMNRVAAVLAWLEETYEKIMGLAGKIFDIHSPSKAFARIGENLMLGMAQGIQTTAGVPMRAAAAASAGVGYSATFNIYQQPGQSSGQLVREIDNYMGRLAERARLGGMSLSGA